MSLTTILSNVDTRLPTGYFSSTLTTTQKKSFVNEAQRWVCRAHNFDFLKRECTQDTVDGSRRYALPDGTDTDFYSAAVWRFKEEISVELIDSDSEAIQLVRGHKEFIENIKANYDRSETGEPAQYAIDQFNIWLYPIPDHSKNDDTAWQINLEYYGYLPDLSDTNTDNFLTAHCPEVLEYKTLALCFEVGQDYSDASYWEQKAFMALKELADEDFSAVHGGIETGTVPTSGNQVGAWENRAKVVTSGGYVDNS